MNENCRAVALAQNEVRCGICGHLASMKYKDHPGYQEPSCFDIMYCANCDTSFANPMEVDNKVYDLIYSNIAQVPGYNRYYGYALEVLKQKNPLEYLSLSEDVYWSVSDFLKRYRISKASSILEVGCGFGYLTFSLVRSGYRATGLDISQEAINNATARYGNNYICAELAEHAKYHGKKYDVVIMTEIIEHIPDIVPFVSDLVKLVKDDGYIVLTAPNKAAQPADVVWATELPPIHLWWLSRNSIENLAKLVGREAIFTDLSKLGRVRPIRRKRLAAGRPTKQPIFSADETLKSAETLRKRSSFSKRPAVMKLKQLYKYFRSGFSGNTTDMEREIFCAVLVKPKG